MSYFITKNQKYFQNLDNFRVFFSLGRPEQVATLTCFLTGPPFYHSSFIVRVEVVCGQTGKSLKERRIRPCTWSDLFGLGR